ncbi:serine/threonine-protein kinase [Sorangium sp. So ce388]|uniref:serine/threonine-protein kinase n=1 Tax=Sorangium sp. So ce388 TaxID=3133309 RepID=UPI003F5C9E3B
MIGSTIDGRYRILRELGAGAMGAVYEAEHTGTGGRVAVKVITGDFTRSPDALSRFQREARAAGVVETQYVTKVYDTGVDRESGLPFLVMEFLSGQDLHSFLKHAAPIAPDLALRIIAQACIGLQKAHEANVVHRDIKPANMFLARREEGEVIVKLVDFGIAKVKLDQAQETESAGLTKTGSLLGSPLYMSPEAMMGTKDLDHRADIWSLGITLYHALAGRTPFHDIPSIGLLIVEITSGHLPPVQAFAPWVPPQVAAIVHGALRRDRAERFQSAAEMLAAIRPLLPHGFGIHESMLVPLDASAQAQVQPRLPMPSAPSRPEFALQARVPEASTSHPAFNVGVTADGMARSHTTTRASSPSSKPLVAALSIGALALLGVGIGGGLLLKRTMTPAPAAEPQVMLPPTETAPSSSPPPPSTAASASAAVSAPAAASASATASAAAPAPVLQQVPVMIIPGDASVEVDGQPVPVKNGIMMLEGAPGSIHHVRVFKAKYQTTVDVTVTERGASPPSVTMSYSVPRSPRVPSPTPGQPMTTPGRKTDFK